MLNLFPFFLLFIFLKGLMENDKSVKTSFVMLYTHTLFLRHGLFLSHFFHHLTYIHFDEYKRTDGRTKFDVPFRI